MENQIEYKYKLWDGLYCDWLMGYFKYKIKFKGTWKKGFHFQSMREVEEFLEKNPEIVKYQIKIYERKSKGIEASLTTYNKYKE